MAQEDGSQEKVGGLQAALSLGACPLNLVPGLGALDRLQTISMMFMFTKGSVLSTPILHSKLVRRHNEHVECAVGYMLLAWYFMIMV